MESVGALYSLKDVFSHLQKSDLLYISAVICLMITHVRVFMVEAAFIHT